MKILIDICLVIDQFDYTFPENGLLAYKNGEEFHKMEFKTYLSEEQIKKLVNFILIYIANLDIPIKRYVFTFIYISYDY